MYGMYTLASHGQKKHQQKMICTCTHIPTLLLHSKCVIMVTFLSLENVHTKKLFVSTHTYMYNARNVFRYIHHVCMYINVFTCTTYVHVHDVVLLPVFNIYMQLYL